MNRKKNAPNVEIHCTRHTPFRVTGLKSLVDCAGNPLPVKPVMALCRCGLSQGKPFCDGSHGPEGIHGEKAPDRVTDRVVDYRGREITIHDNRGACSHDRTCVIELPEVFRKRKRPWIDADAAPVAEVIQTIEKCPSGALSYSLNGGKAPDPARPPKIRVAKNGPLEVTGGIQLTDDMESAPESPEHYTLCRCGKSRNPPFCDGSHRTTRFRDDAPDS